MTEAEIITGCLKNDLNAQRHLYERFASKMMGICMRYAENKEEAEDFLQEGFIKVFQKINQFKGSGSFEGWVKRIIINTALEHFRSKKRMEPIQEDRQYQDVYEVTVVDHISTKELLQLIQQLPHGYRTVFNLHAIEGYGHKEIAEMLQITEGTSKSQYARAKLSLQEKLSELKIV